ncbi:MAG: DUF6522 family protein [Dehalococcoidia bacterium]
MVEFEDGAIQVDAAVVAKGLGVEPPLVQEGMREGRITSLCERGVDDDEGLYRLTFFSENRRFRLTVDNEGNVVQRSAINFGDRGLPASARKPGA